jgi:hypothetical protein
MTWKNPSRTKRECPRVSGVEKGPSTSRKYESCWSWKLGHGCLKVTCCIVVRQYSINYDRVGNDGHVLVARALKLGVIKITKPAEWFAWVDELANKPRTKRRDRRENL